MHIIISYICHSPVQAKDGNRVSGNGRISCPFYNEIDAILGTGAASQPPALLESSNVNVNCVSDNDSEETQGEMLYASGCMHACCFYLFIYMHVCPLTGTNENMVDTSDEACGSAQKPENGSNSGGDNITPPAQFP